MAIVLTITANQPGIDGNRIKAGLHMLQDGIGSAGPGTVSVSVSSFGVDTYTIEITVPYYSSSGQFFLDSGDWSDVATAINSALAAVTATGVADNTGVPTASDGLLGGRSGFDNGVYFFRVETQAVTGLFPEYVKRHTIPGNN